MSVCYTLFRFNFYNSNLYTIIVSHAINNIANNYLLVMCRIKHVINIKFMWVLNPFVDGYSD